MSTALPAFTASLSTPPRADAAGVEALARAALAQLVSLITAGEGSVAGQVIASMPSGLTEMQVKDLSVKLVLSTALPVGQEVDIRMEPPVAGPAPRLVVTPRAVMPQVIAPTEPRALQMAAVELALQGGNVAPMAPPVSEAAPQVPARPVASVATPLAPAGDETPAPAASAPVAAVPAKGVAGAGRPTALVVEMPDVPAAPPVAPGASGTALVADRPVPVTGSVLVVPQLSRDPAGTQVVSPAPQAVLAPVVPSGPKMSVGPVVQQSEVPATVLPAEGEVAEQRPVTEMPVTPARIPYPVSRPQARSSAAAAATLAPLTVADLADPARLEERQGSSVPLLLHLAQTAQAPETPEAVRDAAWRVLARRLDGSAEGLTGKAVAEAMAGAGTLATETSEAPDIRSALLELRQALFKWIGAASPRLPAAQAQPLPPMAGDAPRADRALSLDQPPIVSNHDRAGGLLGETDGAVSRLKLLQLASNPGEPRPGATNPQPTEIRMEVPLLVGRELGLVQFVLERDARPRQQKKERPWRLRFALNFSATGEVGADIALLGRQTQVALWAANAETADALEAMLPELGPALAGKGLDLSSVRVRRGRPQSKAIGPGRMLDGAR